MSKPPEKKLTRAEKSALNKANHAAAKKADTKPKTPVRIVDPADVLPPEKPKPAVASAIPPEHFEPPEGEEVDEGEVNLDHRVTDDRRNLVKVLVAIGVTVPGIARQIRESVATIKHFYAEELAHGAEAILAAVGARAIQGALNGDGRMLGHVTKSLLGWGREKAKPPFMSALLEVEAAVHAGAAVGGDPTSAEARAAAGGKVVVRMRLSENIKVKED